MRRAYAMKKRETAYPLLTAVSVGRTNTEAAGWYRCWAAYVGEAKAVTEIIRKIAVLLYNAMRLDYNCKDSRVHQYWRQYLQQVIRQLHQCSEELGFTSHEVMHVS